MIILVGPLPPPHTGQSVAFKMLADYLIQEGIDTAIVNLIPSATRKIGRFSWLRSFDYSIIFLRYLRYMFARRKKVVYVTIAASKQGFIRDFFFIWTSFLLGKPRLLCHLHGGNYSIFYESQSNLLKFLIRKTLLRTEQIIVLSNGLQENFSFENKLKRKLVVVPNGLSCSDPLYLESKTLPKNLVQNTINILYLSNLIESKGYIDLLKSIKILVNTYNLNIQCNFCGIFMTSPADDKFVKNEVQAQKWFESFVIRNRLENHVFYHGSVYGKEKEEFLKKSHIFVLPTNYIIEGQPISIIEALAYGNVTISTNYRAIPDMVIDSVTGFLIPYRQPQIIAEKVLFLANNPNIYKQMSSNSVRHYRDNFTNARHLEKIVPLLHKNGRY